MIVHKEIKNILNYYLPRIKYYYLLNKFRFLLLIDKKVINQYNYNVGIDYYTQILSTQKKYKILNW